MRFDLYNVNSFSYEPREGCAVQDLLMLQNRSSSAESAHANTDASVSGYCLDSSGEYEMGKQKRDFFKVRRKMGLRKFLRDLNDFEAKTAFGIVLELFCRIETGLRIFLSK